MNPFLLYAQAVHETGDFTSNVFKNNNLFGMKQPTVRENLATGTANGHATFNSQLDSVKDYVLRQKYFKVKPNLMSVDAYISATANTGYAEDTVYQTKWKNIYNGINKSAFYGIGAVLVILPIGTAIALGYWIYTKTK